ncbi:uncharacterized protein B0T15DRAFT_503142 [Chaetomium strumarium]|uniref:Uncharacterized protein n=1 Tax=Chaetomium strumarium TaxID=1170767 RepID=A0AAJ0GU13_9PEZI|nr:hypothetical protein B0T15DRAFT_503142 [Chaetomium strumarium]
MKSIAAILLTLATVATAAPSINANAPADAAAMLSSRQECVYDCGCSSPNSDTAACCAAVGGTLGNEGTLCSDMAYATAQAYAQCCGSYICFKSARDCPDVVKG